LPRVWRLVVAGAFLAVAATACHRDREKAAKPPIILILIDTLRADYLGTYGFQGRSSPQIDRFARQAVVFRNCFSQAPWTKPSVASLFTSMQVPVHRVESHEGRFGEKDLGKQTDTLSQEAVTLAEVLKDGGYATAAFVANLWIRSRHGFGQGFDKFDTFSKGNEMQAEPVLKAAEKWIAELPGDHPYFAYIHLMDVHGPYKTSNEDYEALRDSPSLGPPRALSGEELKNIPGYLRRAPWVGMEGKELRAWRGHYAAKVRAMDRRLGRFFKKLRKSGVFERAVVIITADHGEQLFEHGNWDHGNSLFDEELHVPLIARLPGGKNAGSVDALVSLIDVMPTLVSLAGLPAVDTQGVDLSGLIEKRDSKTEAPGSFASAVKWKPTMHSARTEHYKLITDTNSDETMLFDVVSDPGETQDIAKQSPELAGVERVLEAQLDRNVARGPMMPGKARLSEVVSERLRALGYGEPEPSPSPESGDVPPP
jgi:arylsulfatase A-like enzyme